MVSLWGGLEGAGAAGDGVAGSDFLEGDVAGFGGVVAGAFGAGLSQASTLLAPGGATSHRLLEHATIVLHVGGIAMLAASLPVVRQAPAWAVLGILACAEALPGGPIGRALATTTAGGPSDPSTWLVVAGLWIACLPPLTGTRIPVNATDTPAVPG